MDGVRILGVARVGRSACGPRAMNADLRAVAIGLLLFATACAAWAQMPGGNDPRRGGPGSPGARPPGAPAAAERVAAPNLEELVQMRLGQLEEDLILKPDQRALWNAYRERVLRLLEDTRREARMLTASSVDAPAPKRLDALGDAARNRLAAVEDIVDAGKAFYASLTPAQQAVADRRLALPLATLTGSDTGAAVPRRAPPGSAGGEPAAPAAAGTRP